ncbi:MAG: prepilin-type N-terminal cleavage/methylation domain-containing protein [Verrucomicrobia bacterium]|nr:prepilin-type N-terminal cleavage/methylation domain-containing protein [Verrucomicrobiota bacterium]
MIRDLQRLPILSAPRAAALRAFSLVEMLVVIGLIALIAGLAAPAFKTKSMSMDMGHRQLNDDLNRARQLAISTRSTVYVVFVPLIDADHAFATAPKLPVAQRDVLSKRQLSGYVIFSRRSVGSQPGQEEPRFLSEWKELPEGVFVSTNKFALADAGFRGFLPMDFYEEADINAAQAPRFPLPVVGGARLRRTHYIAFDATGALTLLEDGDVRRNRDKDDWRKNVERRAIVPLMAGSIVYPVVYDGDRKGFDWRAADVMLKAPFNVPGADYKGLDAYIKWVRVDPLTGRSRVEGGEIQ